PELEREGRQQGLLGRDHTRARQLGAFGQCLRIEAYEVGDEQEQAPNARRKLARVKRKCARIGNTLESWVDACGPLVIATAREASKSLCSQHFADGGGTQRRSLRLEFLADLVDRVIAFAQLHDLRDRRAFLGLCAGARASDCKEIG